MFAGITINQVFPPLLTIVLAGFALFVFFAAEGRKAAWCKCLICLFWFDERGRRTEKEPFVARFGPESEGVCPHCVQPEEDTKEENDTVSFSA